MPLSQAEPLMELAGASVRMGGDLILEGVDFRVFPAEVVTVVGPNGGGKTTLARLLVGGLKPWKGTIFRQKGLRTGYMPQRIRSGFNLPIRLQGFLSLGNKASPEEKANLLEKVGLSTLGNPLVRDLSGGEFQRLLLARTVLGKPSLLVLDEPLAGVDVLGQESLYKLIHDIRDLYQMAIVLVSHELHVVMPGSDRVVCLNKRVCCSGVPEVIVKNQEYLALFGREKTGELALYTHRHLEKATN